MQMLREKHYIACSEQLFPLYELQQCFFFVLPACELALINSCPGEEGRVQSWILSQQKFPGFSH